jgi:hypothetical protein
VTRSRKKLYREIQGPIPTYLIMTGKTSDPSSVQRAAKKGVKTYLVTRGEFLVILPTFKKHEAPEPEADLRWPFSMQSNYPMCLAI